MRENGYRKITGILSRRIRRGTYKAGSALPSRMELLEEFGVARATIDHCIVALQQQGLVVSRHGSGTYVCEGIEKTSRVGIISGIMPEAGFLPGDWSVTQYRPESLLHKSDWKRLLEQDGLLWIQPEETLSEVMAWSHGKLPQVAVNRVIEDEYCVSTDHRGAYRTIAGERISQFQGSPVFILNLEKGSLPVEYRTAGVVDACRQHQRFYEILPMPEDFQGKLQMLEDRLPLNGAKPMLLFSVSLSNTGALMRYVARHNLRWRNDLCYSDFDNTYPGHVWGVRVTSFQQDTAELLRKSAALLQRLLNGDAPEEKVHLHFPTRIHGDT